MTIVWIAFSAVTAFLAGAFVYKTGVRDGYARAQNRGSAGVPAQPQAARGDNEMAELLEAIENYKGI